MDSTGFAAFPMDVDLLSPSILNQQKINFYPSVALAVAKEFRSMVRGCFGCRVMFMTNAQACVFVCQGWDTSSATASPRRQRNEGRVSRA